MKKIKIFTVSLLIVTAVVTGYKAWQNSNLTPEEILMKKNIEALAQQESGERCCSWNDYWLCGIDYEGGGTCIGEHRMTRHVTFGKISDGFF